MTDKIEVVNMDRGERYDGMDRPLAPYVEGGGHRVYAAWPDAELEVKRRVLRALSERTYPPDGVAFVRTWEEKQNVGTTAQVQTTVCGTTPEVRMGPLPGMPESRAKARRAR